MSPISGKLDSDDGSVSSANAVLLKRTADFNGSSAHYRPRYSAEESSDTAYEKDRRHRLWMQRRTQALRILSLVVFIFVAGVFTRVYLFFAGIGGDSDTRFWGLWKNPISLIKQTNRAITDSNGFFDVPDYEWKKIKDETRLIIDVQDDVGADSLYLLSESGADIHSNEWWIDNWKANFKCQNKVSIGGKSLCDPTRIISMAEVKAKLKPRAVKKRREDQKKQCIVYVSGGRAIEFEQQFLDFMVARMVEFHPEHAGSYPMPCEVHVFSPDSHEIPDSREGLFVHKWGFRPSNKESMGLSTKNDATTIAFKTLEETITELGHSGKVSILALDCESCEWDIYQDILALDEPIHQVLMQMHGTPYIANDLFKAMQEGGYVIFNRVKESSGQGEVYDYSWLKMAPSFFNWKI
eukprot:CAMPEP_0183713102 /NCGR_PEP_ID=MMETSP0737-20130205/8067_1 /TAXON_ID=385413 /ORGANISM="Thalassiosira miniscula, Strain CCMP1093" /LENGTH=408 /DNA_ID=CAMNT_0025941851 /DNA_START=138 /DNA_END=1364 /DNA_ORIENTATION=+